MDHNKHVEKNKCSCSEGCLCYGAEKLTVSCGCDMEAKQYEYKMSMKCCHSENGHDKKATEEPKNGGTKNSQGARARIFPTYHPPPTIYFPSARRDDNQHETARCQRR